MTATSPLAFVFVVSGLFQGCIGRQPEQVGESADPGGHHLGIPALSHLGLALETPLLPLFLIEHRGEDGEVDCPDVLRDHEAADASFPLVVLAAASCLPTHCATPPFDPRLRPQPWPGCWS